MPEQDDYSDAWNTPTDAADEPAANAKRLKALQDQSNASALQLSKEFETAYQAANQEPKP